jgi:hypothetical protein
MERYIGSSVHKKQATTIVLMTNQSVLEFGGIFSKNIF